MLNSATVVVPIVPRKSFTTDDSFEVMRFAAESFDTGHGVALATLVEIRDDLVFYSYAVRGVEYTASQDVSRLADRLPNDLSAMGAVSVKYDPRNPANSIVIAEEWSGLRFIKAG